MIPTIIPELIRTLDGGECVTIPDAVTIIRQVYPEYRAENLYAAATRFGRDGTPKLRTFWYVPEFGPARRMIPLEEFKRWISRSNLGVLSRPHKRRNGHYG